MKMLRIVIALSFTLGTTVFGVGCAGQGEESKGESGSRLSANAPDAGDSGAPRSTAETFKLYDEPGVVPDPSCDVHTILELDGKHASLHATLIGRCEELVNADPRTYALRTTHDTCGTVIYTGTTTRNGVTTSLTLNDNRASSCESIAVYSRIVVEETTAGRTTQRYSFDGR